VDVLSPATSGRTSRGSPPESQPTVGAAGLYALITPARDEAERLRTLAPTVLAQTLRPATWVIVDDGSVDDTAEVIAALARDHPWIRLVRGGSRPGALNDGRREGRDLLALMEGIRSLETRPELVVKLDADVTLPPEYFERVAAAFAADPRLGIASGSRHERIDGAWQRINLTGNAVEAQCRTYRWSCWDRLQPLEPCLGWDGIDEARAVVAGWRTLIVPDLGFRHHRTMGSRDGRRMRARAAEGIAAHYMGYRPSYLVLRALWHARRDPFSLFMVWGFAGAALSRRPRSEAAARAYVRRQQSLRQLARRVREARGLSTT
jgi:poly-beta-1,6-N-acetyl-D-glucosamine synthase